MKIKLNLYIVTAFLGCIAFGAIGCNTLVSSQSCAVEQRQSPTKEVVVKFISEPTRAPSLVAGHIIIFKSGQTAFALGDYYHLLYTIDDGRTWQQLLPSPEDEKAFGGKFENMVVSFYFVTARRGWMNAERGVWQTEDGGNTWQLVFPNKWRFIDFADGQQGVLSLYKDENHSENYVTHDGGERWHLCSIMSNNQTPSSTYFLTPQQGWGIVHYVNNDEVNGVVHTTDGGCHWQQIWVNSRNSGEQYSAIYFLNDSEGWLAGEDHLYHSTNGGEIWQKIWSPKEGLQITDIYFANNKNGWIVAATPLVENAGVFSTSDGGKTWQKLTNSELITDLPAEWKAGELLQMLYASRSSQ